MNQRVKEKNKWIDRLINFVVYGCVLALIYGAQNETYIED